MRQRGLTWPSQEQREIEFRTAKHHLHLSNGAPALPGTVLPSQRDYEDPITKRQVKLTYRFFIDSQGVVYAKASGLLDKGASGAVTIAETIDGQRWAVKESCIHPHRNHETIKLMVNIANNESAISRDLSKSRDTFWVDKDRQTIKTIIYTYLGVSLEKYLKENKNNLTDEQRLDLGIKVTRVLHELHSGLASKTKEMYAHLDIKPGNITIDDDGNVHLIDFGFSEKNPNEMMKKLKGTRDFLMPCDDHSIQAKWEMDVFALMRTLYTPPVFKILSADLDRYIECQRNNNAYNACILTDEIVNNNLFLRAYKQTIAYGKIIDHHKKLPTALALHVELIFARYNLDRSTRRFPQERLELFAKNYHEMERLSLCTAENLEQAWLCPYQLYKDIADAKQSIQSDFGSANDAKPLSLKIEEIWADRRAFSEHRREKALAALHAKLNYRYLVYNKRSDDESQVVRFFKSGSKSSLGKLEATIKMIEIVIKLRSNAEITASDLELGMAAYNGDLGMLRKELFAFLPTETSENTYNALSNRS